MFFKKFFKHLTKIKSSEPLSPFSLILIIFLDIFVLINIFNGLDNQTQLLTSPNEYIPYIYRDIIIDENWVEGNRVKKLSRYILDRYDPTEYKDAYKKIHPICGDVIMQFDNIASDDNLISLFRERDKLLKNYNSFDQAQKLKNSDAEKILIEIDVIDIKINQNSKIEEFWKITEGKGDVAKILADDFKKYKFWFPAKELALQFIFLIPLLAAFIWWFSVSTKKNRELQIFISSHLIVVAFIPIFFHICDFILSILPLKFLKPFIDFLKSIKIISFWHYIIIFIAICSTLFFIYIIQKKVFSRERLIKNRFLKHQCIFCGKKQHRDSSFCPDCGSKQKAHCPACGKETLAGSSFCTNCGKEMKIQNWFYPIR